MKNCPNCGSPIEPYKCKCEYCGTWYFDFTSFDVTENVPYYVKFKTPMGEITTLAKPELNMIEISHDSVYTDPPTTSIYTNRNCDFQVTFQSQIDKETNSLFVLKAGT